MPIYLYACVDCGTELERSFTIASRPDTVPCPVCGVEANRRFTSPAVRLRGAGWASHPEREVANRRKGPQPKGADINERRYLGE